MRTAVAPIDAPFRSVHVVWLTNQQFAALAKAGALDTAMYGWGHCGPCYYDGRVVIHDATLGG